MTNIGSGEEVTIRQLAELIFEVVGFDGDIVFDTSKPDGTPRKLLDSSRLAQLGWVPKISLRVGIKNLYLVVTTQPSDRDALIRAILNEKTLRNAHILPCMLRLRNRFFVQPCLVSARPYHAKI
jgi:hypothetical protein